KLSPINLKRIRILIDLLVILFALSVLIIGGTWLVWSRFHLGQVSAAMEIPVGYVYLILPVSGLIISFYSMYFIKQNMQS
ncbi:MAG TPA: TRAP transporter small permease, partial [Bacteroidales bacterium]|nr:TRAP transporter small permease [Bacteroidales bacterium]